MKNTTFLVLFLLMSFGVSAQDISLQAMEKRAKEMIRVIGLTDKNEYRKFIKENYTEALINRPMRQNIQGADEATTTEQKSLNNLEAKVSMFERLHDDIGNGKILSMKRTAEKLSVEVQGETGSNLIIGLTFVKIEAGLIDAISIQMTMGR